MAVFFLYSQEFYNIAFIGNGRRWSKELKIFCDLFVPTYLRHCTCHSYYDKLYIALRMFSIWDFTFQLSALKMIDHYAIPNF